VAVVPFILPKMHDRYFFAADLMSIGLAFTNRRLWFVPVLFQCSSLLAYVPVLSNDPLSPVPAGTSLAVPAVLINCVAVGFLAVHYWRTAGGTVDTLQRA
jgi:hypothetical protein